MHHRKHDAKTGRNRDGGMTAFGTSRLTTESTDGSIGTSPTRFRAWDLGADTLVRRFATRGTRLEPDLRNRSRIGVLPLDPCAEYNASCAGVPGDAMCWARRTRCGGDAVFGGAKSSGARFSEDSDRAD